MLDSTRASARRSLSEHEKLGEARQDSPVNNLATSMSRFKHPSRPRARLSRFHQPTKCSEIACGLSLSATPPNLPIRRNSPLSPFASRSGTKNLTGAGKET